MHIVIRKWDNSPAVRLYIEVRKAKKKSQVSAEVILHVQMKIKAALLIK